MRGRQTMRTWTILRALESARRGLTHADIAALELDCSERTLYRDLETLVTNGFAVRKEDGRYHAVRGVDGAPGVPLDPSMVLALMLSEDLLQPLDGTVLAAPLAELRSRLSAQLTPQGRAFLGELRETVLGTTFASTSYATRADAIRTLQDAIGRQHRVRIRYGRPNETARDRTVEPYFTWVSSGRLYLVGHDVGADDVRTFAVQRIQEAEVLDEAFDPDPSFDPAEFVRRGIGVYHGPVHHVLVDFNAEVAHLARERTFHRTQQLRDRPDGTVRLTMDSAGLPEIAAWVASFGGRVRPVAPTELVERVRAIHRAGLDRLSDPDPLRRPGT